MEVSVMKKPVFKEDELSLVKGSRVIVMEKCSDEWWKCKNSRGQIGLVPKNYVVIIKWYYGNVTRHQAECALNERGVEGDFLVRDSESSVSDNQHHGLYIKTCDVWFSKCGRRSYSFPKYRQLLEDDGNH
uniref:NCK adaptor protein 2 n=1 Tax=Pavo cristatus TaxID=9049 RepID=A0A8C9LCW2_PAVCR